MAIVAVVPKNDMGLVTVVLQKNSDKWCFPFYEVGKDATADDVVKMFCKEFSLPYDDLEIKTTTDTKYGLESVCVAQKQVAGDYRHHDFADKMKLLREDLSYDYKAKKSTDVDEASSLLTPYHKEILDKVLSGVAGKR